MQKSAQAPIIPIKGFNVINIQFETCLGIYKRKSQLYNWHFNTKSPKTDLLNFITAVTNCCKQFAVPEIIPRAFGAVLDD